MEATAHGNHQVVNHMRQELILELMPVVEDMTAAEIMLEENMGVMTLQEIML